MFAVVVPLARDRDRIIEVFSLFIHGVPYVWIEETFLQQCNMNDLELIPTQTNESSKRISSFFYFYFFLVSKVTLIPYVAYHLQFLFIEGWFFFLFSCVMARPKTLPKTSSCKKKEKNSFGGIKMKFNLVFFCQKVAFWYKKISHPDTNKGASTNTPYILADTCPIHLCMAINCVYQFSFSHNNFLS